ncbi:MAG: AMP-binding protein [Myxococcales bacterium]|nr:AMP-binding protein [Myxococcales bacterium]
MIAHLVGRSLAPPPAATLRELLGVRAQSGSAWLFFHQGKHEPRALSFADADALSSRWARALHEAGVRGGDRVALLLPNGPDFIGAFFGAHELGATPVPLPWPVVTLGPLSLPKGADAVLSVAGPRVLVAPGPVEGVRVPVVSAPAVALAQRPKLTRSSAPAFVQFTSGSTGRPRGAVISQRSALVSAWAMADALGLTPKDVGVAWLPFFHDMGLVGVVLASLAAGFPVHVLPPGEFLLRPRRWLELLSEKRATITVAPNFAFELVLRRAAAAFASLDLSALRFALNGSEPVLRGTLDAFQKAGEAAGLKRGAVLPVYGLAENALGVTFQAESAPDADVTVDGRSVPSVGVPLAGMDVAVRRPDGAVALAGEEGEITVRGPAVMDGYLGDDEATARALRDGWLWTGDRGVVQHERLFITGREKDLIIKAGRKFHPADIEQQVASLVDAPPNGVAAFSVLREAQGGEELVVVVELRRQAEGDVAGRIRGHLSEALGVMADRVELVGAGELPRTTSGKLRRGECIARFGGRP